jgi:hypothetical protein
MDVCGPFWPSQEDQAVMADFCVQYPTLALGACYLFGAYRQAGLTRSQAALEVCHSLEQRGAVTHQERG